MRLKSGGVRLDGTEILDLRDALRDSFNLNRFQNLLLYQLNRDLAQIVLLVPGLNIDDVLRDVIQAADTDFWSAELVQAARAARPESPKLLAFAQRYGLAPTVEFARHPSDPLEAQVRAANSMHDPAAWRALMGQIEARVCHVELPARTGTGFLVGPRALMTNHHVLQPLLDGQVQPADVALRFDFKRLADGTILPGTVHRLSATDWRIDASPPSEVDKQPDTPGALPNPDELDYAVVRLAGAPGNERIGERAQADPEAPPRGWLTLPESAHPFAMDSPLTIMQHPDERPLKVAFDTSAVLDVGNGGGLNGNGTRVRYRTNTDRGSSGSPCFDENWTLVALHHSGDPNYEQLRKAEYNQGIPIARIRMRLGDKLALLAQ